MDSFYVYYLWEKMRNLPNENFEKKNPSQNELWSMDIHDFHAKFFQIVIIAITIPVNNLTR